MIWTIHPLAFCSGQCSLVVGVRLFLHPKAREALVAFVAVGTADNRTTLTQRQRVRVFFVTWPTISLLRWLCAPVIRTFECWLLLVRVVTIATKSSCGGIYTPFVGTLASALPTIREPCRHTFGTSSTWLHVRCYCILLR
jgi:hypothetical protein